LTRCAWAVGDTLMSAYHDTEWGVPVHDGRRLWEMLQLEGFQAGLSWRTILYRREGFLAAFANFDPEIIARFGAEDIDRLMGDPGIVRARAKILATIGNAKAYLAGLEAGESFADFVWSFVDGKPIRHDGLTASAKLNASSPFNLSQHSDYM